MKLSTTDQRSRMMASIRGKDTHPELSLRLALFAAGFRYRLHVRGMPGTPDLVLPRYRAVIFVHGCFWHRHVGCKYTTTPKSNNEFWHLKFKANVVRDERNSSLLRMAGWRVGIVWECALKRSVPETVEAVSHWLRSQEGIFAIG